MTKVQEVNACTLPEIIRKFLH